MSATPISPGFAQCQMSLFDNSLRASPNRPRLIPANCCRFDPLPRVLANRAVVGYTVNMKLSITLDRDEDGIWVAECPSIPGCVSQGKTKPEALKNIKEAIALCMEVRAERGLPLTIETRQVEVLV